MSRVGITLLCLALLAAPALADRATGLCEFYGAQPPAARVLLKATGWNCLKDGKRWFGSNPCRWGPASGVKCDGGVTVSSIVRNCGASGGPLGGPLTSSLTLYTSLSTLVFSGCGLTGTIPTVYSAKNVLPSLRMLDLSNNRLTGILPILMGQAGSMDSLYTLDLSNNKFFGILPGQWATNGYFPNLKLLALNNNPLLIGVVPAVWGKTISSRPAAIKINLCNTRVRGPLSPTMDGGSIQIFGQLASNKMCGKLPATFAGAGYQAGIYPCNSWPLAVPAQKYIQVNMPACQI